MNHANVTAPCASCHTGSTASGKPPRHFVTTLPCETCHRTAAWTPVTYRHSSPLYQEHGPTIACSGCHITNAQAVPFKFPAFRPDCGACHAASFRPMAHVKTQRPVTIFYMAAELKDCAGACHIYSDKLMTTIVTRRSGEHRANRGGW
jgi:hypothetical protein